MEVRAQGTQVQRTWQLDGATATVRLAFEQSLPFDISRDWGIVEAALDHLMRVVQDRAMDGARHDDYDAEGA
jgi:hypothetical protein